MRMTKFLLAVALVVVGLFGAPWWIDMAAETAMSLAPQPKPTHPPVAIIEPAKPAPEEPGELWVDVDQKKQVVRIYEGQREIKVMPASTGISSSPTPNGQFTIMHRGEWFYSQDYEQGGYYWTALDEWGEYLFHSVPFTEERELIVEEAALLGQPASHGCIRLSLEDAKWIHDHIPAGAKVIIHE